MASLLNFKDTLNAVRLTLLSDGAIVPIIIGERGIGKTALAAKVAAIEDMNYAHIDGNLLKEGEVGGLPTVDEIGEGDADFLKLCRKLYRKREEFEPEELSNRFVKGYKKYLRNSKESRKVTVYATFHILEQCRKWYEEDPEKKTLLFIDELNRAEHAVQQELMNLILNREINGFQLPENVVLLTAGNPSSKYSEFKDVDYQIADLDPAQEDRLRWFFLGSDPKVWLDWATEPLDDNYEETRIDPDVIEYISINPEALNQPHLQEDVTPSPRAWERVSITYRIFKKIGGFKKKDLYNCIKGDIGSYYAISFIQFLEDIENPLIKAAEIFEEGVSDSTNVGEILLAPIRDRILSETMIRQLVIVKNCLLYILNKRGKEKNVLAFIELVAILPKDLMVSVMMNILEDHKSFHNRLIKYNEYLNIFHDTDKLVD